MTQKGGNEPTVDELLGINRDLAAALSEERLKLQTVEKALRKNPLIAMFLDQGFWHAHHVDIVIRYNGENKQYEADWIKDIWYVLPKVPKVRQGL